MPSQGRTTLSIVEGSVTTPHDAEIQHVRGVSQALVTIGACATAGGIQALRNFADVEEFTRPRLRLAGVRLDARDLDADLRARPCRLRAARLPDRQGPVARGDHGVLHGRRPGIPSTSVCTERKRRGTVCVVVAHGTPCLGPVTHAGCGASRPAYNRGCYGCFGPKETPNTASLTRRLQLLGPDDRDVERVYRTFNADAGVPGGVDAWLSGGRSRPTTSPASRAKGDVGAAAGRHGRARGAADLRAATVLRSAASGALVPRTARHHRPHLRHLPGCVPDERGERDR